MSDPQRTTDRGDGHASDRHRVDEVSRAPAPAGPTSAESDVNGRRALLALGVAAIGTVAFAIGLRSALRRLPPERPAGAAAVTDSGRGRRFAPPAPNQPDGYPRLR